MRLRPMVLSLLAAALPAGATTIQATFVGSLAGGSIERNIIDAGSGWRVLTVGTFDMTRVGGDHPAPPSASNGKFISICIEPLEGVTAGNTYTWTVGSLAAAPTNVPGGMGSVRADRLLELWGRNSPLFGLNLTPVQAAALQVATWEIVRETAGTYDVANGNVQFRNESLTGTMALAQAMLNQIDGTGWRAYGILALTLNGSQDIIVQVVPEPEHLALGGLLVIIGLAGRRRRRIAP